MANPNETKEKPKTEASSQEADLASQKATLKEEVNFMEKMGEKLKELKDGVDGKERIETLKEIGGLIVGAFLGYFMDKNKLTKVAEAVGIKVTEVQQNIGEKNHKVRPRRETVDDGNEMLDPGGFKIDKVISKKQTFANMHAMGYFEKNGKPKENATAYGRIVKKEKARPSTFILKGPGELMKGGLGSFEDFKKNAMDKLVSPDVTDPKERERQAAVILSCCAMGRFQIVPYSHFKRAGWPVQGEPGLRAMHAFMRSSDRQYHLFKKILEGSWRRHHDAGLVAFEYYKGSGVSEYKANPMAEKFQTRQGPKDANGRGKYASVHEYVQDARHIFEENRRKYPQLSEMDCLAMSIEQKESSGHYVRDRLLGKISTSRPEVENGREFARSGNRVMKHPVSKEALDRGYLQNMHPNDKLVITSYCPEGRQGEIKETVHHALAFANELARKDGYQILLLSGYRDPNLQSRLKDANVEKRGDTNKWVAKAGKSWHQSGSAVDVALFPINSRRYEDRLTNSETVGHEKYRAMMEKYMNAAGFVRYEAEAWHFEIGSSGWANTMKSAGLIDRNVPLEDITYERDQPGEESHHEHGGRMG